MLIYGNTPADIVKMMFRNKTKVLIVAGAVVLAVALGTNKAVADEHDPIKTLQTNIVELPGKVVTHISNEIEATKEYQAKSWAQARAQWLALKTKFLSN
jgi:hypothetical protein